jgi:hypothetical protein
MGHAGRHCLGLSRWLPDPRPCARVRLLFPDLAVGHLDDVRSSGSSTRRCTSLHGSPDHIVGDATGHIPEAFCTPPGATDFQEPIPSLSHPQAKTVESSCGRKRLPPSDHSTVPTPLFKHSLSCSHPPRDRRSSNRARTAKRLNQAAGRSDLRLVQDAGHMVTYADGTAMAKAVETMRTAS